MVTTDSCFLGKEGIYQRRGKGEAQYGENIAGIVLEKFTSAAEKIYPFCLFFGIL